MSKQNFLRPPGVPATDASGIPDGTVTRSPLVRRADGAVPSGQDPDGSVQDARVAAGRPDRGTVPGRAPVYSSPGARPGQGLAVIAAAMSEDRGPDSLDAHVRKLMKDLGLWGFHVEKSLDEDEGRTNVSEKGWPDWTIIGTRIIYRELKSERGKVSREQQAVGRRITEAGGDWDIWKPRDLLSGRLQAELIAISRLRVAGGAA